MSNIDKAFNTIWNVRRKRSHLATFTVYWAILSLGPILIAISVGVTSYLVSIPFFDDTETVAIVRSRLLSMMPILISALAFTLLYALVPNRSVMLRHAIAGGVLAASLFEVSKRVFALYVTTFPTYEAIYGALAVVPIFLIWLYLSWFVTLLGAEFTYCLGIYRYDWRGKMQLRGDRFMLAVNIMQILRQSQCGGLSVTISRLHEQLPESSEAQLDSALSSLQRAHLVLRTEDKGWALARDLQEVTLAELYNSDAYVLPSSEHMVLASDAFRALIGQANRDLEEIMQRPLIDLL
jgi:membrane protein